MSTETRDETWYIGIMQMGSHYSVFEGAYGEQYRNFKGIAGRRGVEIAAERFGVSDDEMNLLTGFSRDGGLKTEEHRLSEFWERLNSGRVDDPQKALDDLCDSVVEQKA